MELLTPAIISLIVQFCKRFKIAEKLNGLGVHIFLIILALIASAFKFGFEFLPEVYAISIVQIWAGAVLFYEFLIKSVYKEVIKHEK